MSKSSGSGDTYKGNVGIPYGSNIIEVSANTARDYQNVVRFTGCNTDSWVVVIWNKYGRDDKMDGWYGNACHHFTLMPGEVKFFAFMNNSQGGLAAAQGSTIPTDSNGGYASTWGEWDFASLVNANWSGFDVSAISAQDAGLEIQGMKICEANSGTCSSITASGEQVDNAYTIDNRDVGGVGGNLPAGQVRLAVVIDYSA